MRKKWIAAAVTMWAVGALFIGSGGVGKVSDWTQTVKAAKQSESTQTEIDTANKKRDELQKEKADLQKTINSTENKKDNVLEYISTLDGKLEKLTKKMKSNEEEIDVVEADIDTLKTQEAEVTAKMNSQYETMKARIKYMYEDGNTGYLELLVGSTSLSEMYNHLEYISKISEYDQKMYGEYEKTQKTLAETQEKKESKKEELEATKENLSFEKQSINELIGKKKSQLSTYNKLLSDSESSISSYDAKIQAQENQVESLLARQRKEIAAEEVAAARQQKSSNDGGSQVSQSNQKNTSQTANNTVSTSGYLWPLASAGRISCGFGPRSAPTKGASTYHKGIDIATPTGTVVRAAKEGKVVTATYSSSAGNYVAIYHGNGVYTYYMHNSALRVSVGDQVSRGQTIALSGSTGISTGPHLHFAVFAGGSYVNPLNYVSR